MKFISVDDIYKRSGNKYLACVVIAKRAKKYNSENYEYFIKEDTNPPEGVERTHALRKAISDFMEGELDEKIEEYS
ncbi:MAG: hypothetical protein R6U31_00790 [bacterium]